MGGNEYKGPSPVNTQALPISSEPCPQAPDPKPGLQALSWEPPPRQGGEMQLRNCPALSPKAPPRILSRKDPSLGMASSPLCAGRRSSLGETIWERALEHKGSKTTSLALRILI